MHGASCVVYTTFTANTIEVSAARAKGIPVVHRAQVLQEISKDRRLIAVAGTHGKSTTTVIIATALTALGQDPSYLIGADLDEPGSGARHGKGDLMVAEAGESDHSFEFLHARVAVVTRIAHDHHVRAVFPFHPARRAVRLNPWVAGVVPFAGTTRLRVCGAARGGAGVGVR